MSHIIVALLAATAILAYVPDASARGARGAHGARVGHANVHRSVNVNRNVNVNAGTRYGARAVGAAAVGAAAYGAYNYGTCGQRWVCSQNGQCGYISGC